MKKLERYTVDLPSAVSLKDREMKVIYGGNEGYGSNRCYSRCPGSTTTIRCYYGSCVDFGTPSDDVWGVRCIGDSGRVLGHITCAR